MDLKLFEKLIRRIFPGLGVYSASITATVDAVTVKQLVEHHQIRASVSCDVRLLLDNAPHPDFEKPLKAVPFKTASRHLIDVPRVGDVVLIEFTGWRANSAIIRDILLDRRSLPGVAGEGVTILAGMDQLFLGDGGDFAVLASKVAEYFELTWDLIDELGSASNMGGPLPNAASVAAKVIQYKQTIDEIASEIKLGATTNEP